MNVYSVKEDSNQVKSKSERKDVNTVKRMLSKIKDAETVSFDEEVEWEDVTATVRRMSLP